ncbi:MAG: prolyl-tRNA synthetase associated domain-containing protein [Alphaproteobacteria bacterium]|nr:prolyl-tRNA synthetase associated domain-containing protein [Alphaproteobacteria bacterium]
MLKTQDELLEVLSKIGIEYTNHEHPAVFTVKEADEHQDGIEGAHNKNLFLKDKKKNLFLVVTLANKQINLKELAKKIGAKSPSFGKPELLEEVLGVTPGSVTPFSVININGHDVKIVLDEEMMENEQLNYHPLVNTATTTISSKNLLKFMDHCNQKPEIIRL